MSSTKKLRACLLCSFVASPAEFRKLGCPNCDDKLEMKGDQDRVMMCTTAQFDGVVAMISPDESWVAKWQRNDKHVPGVYAVRVTGQLPDEIAEDLEGRGISAVSRENDD
ncbi:transcription elongation factor spt4 [Rhodotorula kratochvilovae]